MFEARCALRGRCCGQCAFLNCDSVRAPLPACCVMCDRCKVCVLVLREARGTAMCDLGYGAHD